MIDQEWLWWSDEFWRRVQARFNDFTRLGKDRMRIGQYRYGSMLSADRPQNLSVKMIQERLTRYQRTGNTENLVDIANACMVEWMYPEHKKAHFETHQRHQ